MRTTKTAFCLARNVRLASLSSLMSEFREQSSVLRTFDIAQCTAMLVGKKRRYCRKEGDQ